MNNRQRYHLIKGIMGLGIVLMATQAMAEQCSEFYDYVRFDVQNHTSHRLYVDMGTPYTGQDTGSGYVEVGSYRSFEGCSFEGSHSGYKSHIYLYDRHTGAKKLLADWDVNEPYWDPTSISYHHDSDECKIAVWRYGLEDGWSSWRPMSEHNTAGSYSANTQTYVQCGNH